MFDRNRKDKRYNRRRGRRMDRILMYISFLIIMLFYKSESICDKKSRGADKSCSKCLEEKMAELQKQMMENGGDGYEVDVEYKKRVMELAKLQEERRRQKESQQGYIFEGVNVDQKLKDAEEEIKRAEKLLKEHEEIAAEVNF